MVRQIDFSRLTGEGGTQRRHLGAIAIPIISMHHGRARHAVGRRIHTRRDQRAADVGGVIDRRGRVHDHHPPAEFLVTCARTPAVPQTDGDTRAVERVWRCL